MDIRKEIQRREHKLRMRDTQGEVIENLSCNCLMDRDHDFKELKTSPKDAKRGD